MLRPNLSATIYRKAAQRDIFGGETFSAGKPIRLCCVSLSSLAEASTVRADSSASRGSAEDLINQAKILTLPTMDIEIGDVIDIKGFMIEVTGFHPRFDTRGQHHHNELRAKVRAEL